MTHPSDRVGGGGRGEGEEGGEDREGNQTAMRERKGKGNGVRKGMERWKQDLMIPNGKKMELSYIT